MWANMLPKVRPSLQLLCHLITNYTPLLHDNDVGRRRCNQWPNKTIHHHSHRGNKRGDHRGARISEGHHGRQGHRGNRGDRRRKSRQWHRSNRKYRDRGRHREHRASGPRRGHLAGGSSSHPRGHHGIGSSTRRGDPDSGRRRRHRARGSHRRDPVSGRRRGFFIALMFLSKPHWEINSHTNHSSEEIWDINLTVLPLSFPVVWKDKNEIQPSSNHPNYL
ncbi:unnamed protein product [Arctogadus glacialis]